MQISKESPLTERPSLPLAEATASVRGVELLYRTGGSGPPLLLLHGGLVTGHIWDPFIDDLGKHHTVIVPDLPGHGRSTRLPGAFSHREMARAMLGLLDGLEVNHVRGIGHSYGATTLVHMATQQPDRVQAMVVVGAGHRLSAEAREIVRGLRLEGLSQELQDYLNRYHPGGEPQIRWALAQGRGLADNYADFDLSPEHLATIPTWTLIVLGDRDPFLPVEMALEMHRAIPRSALWVVPGQGHTPIWEWLGGSHEAATIFCTVVQEFFEQSQSS